MNYDLLLQGGHVVDPANKLNAVRDIAIKDGRIPPLQRASRPPPPKK